MKDTILNTLALLLVSSSHLAIAAPRPDVKRLSSRQDLALPPTKIAEEIEANGKDASPSPSGLSGLDTPQCLWQKTGPGGIGAINFYVQIPNWQPGFDEPQAVGDLKASIGADAGCASGEITGFQYSIIGNSPAGGPAINSTLAADIFTSSFCTAWKMTNIIAATTGLKGIDCNEADSSEKPDGPRPESPDPVDGSDGFEGNPALIGDDPEPAGEVPKMMMKRGMKLDESHLVWINGPPHNASEIIKASHA